MSRSGICLSVSVLILFAHAVAFTGVADAQQDDFFIGIGGSYQFVNQDPSWGSNKWGVNAKIGYFVARNASLQVDMDYIPNVDAFVEDVDIYSAMFSLKAYILDMKRVRFTVVRPFAIAGVGGMHAKTEALIPAITVTNSGQVWI